MPSNCNLSNSSVIAASSLNAARVASAHGGGLRDPCKTRAEIAIQLAQLKSTPTKPIGTAFKIFQHHSNISQSLGSYKTHIKPYSLHSLRQLATAPPDPRTSLSRLNLGGVSNSCRVSSSASVARAWWAATRAWLWWLSSQLGPWDFKTTTKHIYLLDLLVIPKTNWCDSSISIFWLPRPKLALIQSNPQRCSRVSFCALPIYEFTICKEVETVSLEQNLSCLVISTPSIGFLTVPDDPGCGEGDPRPWR